MKTASILNNKVQHKQIIQPLTGKRNARLQVVAAVNSDLGSSLAQGVRQYRAANGGGAPVEAPTVQPVPGVEILSSTGPSAPPPVTQGMDIVMEKLAAQQAPLKSSTAAASKSVLSAVDSLGDTAGDAAAQASAAAAEAANAVGNAVGGTAAAATAAASGVASDVQKLLENFLSEANNEAAIVQDNINSLTEGVQSTISSSVSQVQSQIGAQATTVLNQLPPPVKEALVAAASEAGNLVDKAAADPQMGAAAAGLGVGIPALLLWLKANGGFAGSYTAEQAENVLQTQNALLVDVRTEAKRLENGMPELKRGARGKGAAVSPVMLPPSIARRVKNADALALEMLGAQIAGLAKVNGGTRVIIMDDQGKKAKAIARAVSAAGVGRAYVLQGGFKAWNEAGFKVRPNSTQFDDNPLAALGDVTESVVEEAEKVFIKDPKNLVIGGAAATGVALFCFNYHLVFEYFGVLGLELTILLKLISYDSPQELLDDLSGVFETVSGFVGSSANKLQQQQQFEESERPLNEQVPAE